MVSSHLSRTLGDGTSPKHLYSAHFQQLLIPFMCVPANNFQKVIVSACLLLKGGTVETEHNIHVHLRQQSTQELHLRSVRSHLTAKEK